MGHRHVPRGTGVLFDGSRNDPFRSTRGMGRRRARARRGDVRPDRRTAQAQGVLLLRRRGRLGGAVLRERPGDPPVVGRSVHGRGRARQRGRAGRRDGRRRRVRVPLADAGAVAASQRRERGPRRARRAGRSPCRRRTAMTQALGPFAGRGPSLGAGTDAAVQPGVVGSIHAHVREAQENIDTVLAAVLGIQNNVTLSAAVPPVVPRPIAGTRPIEIHAYLYDSAGGMEDPDDLEILVRIRKSDGTFITDRLYQDVLFAVALPNATDVAAFPIASGWRAMLRTGVGLFDMFYKASSTDAEEELLFEFGWEEAAVPVFQSRPLRVTGAADADTVAADVTAILYAIGTLVNTGGTATLGGMLGDPANSSFIVRIAAIKAVVDTLATAAALAAVQAGTDALQLDVAAVQADTDDIQSKVGTPVNTGGTATLAAILGDAANSSIVARIIATKAVVDTLATAAALALAQTDIDDIQAKIGTPEAALASLAGQIGIGTEAEGTAGAAAESLHAKRSEEHTSE